MIAPTLAGKVALVTGSTTGIGRALAEAMGRAGAAIVAHGRDAEQAAEILDDWRQRGWTASASVADLGTADGVATLVHDVIAGPGTPDILVLNASIELPESWRELSSDAIERQVAVNLTASCALIHAFLPAMLERGWGRIVAIGSVQEERPNARHLFYVATKAALTSIILNLARNERSPGVTFNVVRPGAILTKRNRDALADEAFARAIVDRIPLGRVGTPDDCVGAVMLICSDAGAYINGAVLAVDGGMRL